MDTNATNLIDIIQDIPATSTTSGFDDSERANVKSTLEDIVNLMETDLAPIRRT